jgi:3-deoxy-D-arabino-heptulosonate 7-phosphate (DAHP) synthase
VEEIQTYGNDARILVWLGARNQNHIEQRRISQVLASGPSTITFMFKNQMWADERHWFGIYEHITSAGFPPERLMICHRGFAPGKMSNPEGLRNLPDFDMAMSMKNRTQLPMILDPSHIGGTRENVIKIIAQAKHYDFDGYIIEVHHEPEKAKTDINQQLSIREFQDILSVIKLDTH